MKITHSGVPLSLNQYDGAESPLDSKSQGLCLVFLFLNTLYHMPGNISISWKMDRLQMPCSGKSLDVTMESIRHSAF